MFKTKEPRRFDYMPRYHNPKKEEMEERYKKAEIELGVSDGAPRKRIKFERRGMTYGEDYKKQARTSVIRTLVIILGLCIVFWVLFQRIDDILLKYLQ